jgi:hypothetical protein
VDGDGLAVIYEWKGPVPPAPAPPQKQKAGSGSLSSTLHNFFSNQAQSIKAAATDYIVNPAIQTYDAAHNWIVSNPKTVDTANLGLDLWGVAASGAALLGFGAVTTASTATGVGAPVAAASGTATAASWLALVSSSALVGADGRHLYLELRYGDATAKNFEKTEFYDKTEKFVPVLLLFDPLREATQAIRAGRELKTIPQATAAAAREMSAANAAAAQALAQAAHDGEVLGKVQEFVAKPGHMPSAADDKFTAALKGDQASAKAAAAAATARAAEAEKRLTELTEKAKKLQEKISDYMALSIHFQEATLLRDGITNAWSVGNYGFNNPFAANSGEKILMSSTRSAFSDPLQALAPASLSHGFVSSLVHYLSIGVAAVGGPRGSGK